MNQNKQNTTVDTPWQKSFEAIAESLEVSIKEGLSSEEAQNRLEKYGENELQQTKKMSAFQILVHQFKSWIVALLAAAALLSFLFGDIVEGVAVVAVIVINALIGFVTEIRAVRSMESLLEMGSITTKVRRNGETTEVDAEMIVPGDILVLDGGDVVTADARILEANKLQANESALTGESVPVNKHTEAIEGEPQIADRKNMVYKGTHITRGSGEAIVVATGMHTELGHISSLVEGAEEEVTPLEERLDQLGTRLIWVTIGLAVVIIVFGLIAGKDLVLMVKTAIALAVASIPEGLPIVATIALARGMWRMAKRDALINRLSSVETLGATNVILTDKTGTLTENKMTLVRILLSGEQISVSGEGLSTQGDFKADETSIDVNAAEAAPLYEALKIGVLCNNASLKAEEDDEGENLKGIGDPTEVALLVAGRKAGLRYDELVRELPEEREVAFDPDVKMMATFHQKNGNYLVAVKGAAEAVLPHCVKIRTADGETDLDEDQRQSWLTTNNKLAQEGLRILAVASKQENSLETEPYQDLTFLGLVALLDPPRMEVRESIKTCQAAGIKVIMVTGDQPATAKNIAEQVGLYRDNEEHDVVNGQDLKNSEDLSEKEFQRLVNVPVFARVNPEQKLDLIALHQKNNAIVAMTGDGVNDAPALKKADIGVAMGQRGTQVAQEASDMVLMDDSFQSIVTAIEQGRVIFDNIRKFVVYLISCNLSEIMVVASASLVNAPLPITPLQILFLNLVTDVFPALALGISEGKKEILTKPPRDPKEPIVTRDHWLTITMYGVTMTAAVLGVFAIALLTLKMGTPQAVTISFLTLALAQLWHVFNMHAEKSFFRNEVVSNPYVWGAIALSGSLLLLAVYLPPLADLLQVVHPGTTGWLMIIGMSVVPMIVGELLKMIKPLKFLKY